MTFVNGRSTMNLIRLVPVLLVLFVLGACGGGGSSGPAPMAPEEPMEPMEPEEPTEPTGPTEEEQQAKIDGLTMAIADPDGDGKFPETNELNNRRPDNGVTITFGNGGLVTVDSDRLGMNDPTIRNTMEFQPKTESRASVSGFTSSVHERMKDGKTDTLTLYTNADAPKSQVWNDFYTTTYDTAGVSAAAPTTTVPTGTTQYNVLTIAAATGGLNADVAARIQGPRIGREIGTDEDAVRGTYHGVPGTFSCATACTLTENTDGGTNLDQAMTFTPSNTIDDTQDAHMIEGVILDMDYLTFGYWIQTMPMGDETKYSVGTFFGGLPEFTAGSINALAGTATYDGSATGLYARKDLSIEDGSVVGTPAAAGQFSADVSLTANFGPHADYGTSENYMISGMVDNFQDASGDMIDDWELKLNAATFNQSGSENAFSSNTGSGDMMGQWRGMFYGSDADSAMPSGVAGEFTGQFTNGHVIGAFGATTSN